MYLIICTVVICTRTLTDIERMNDIVNKREETVNEREKAGRQMTGDAQEREADMTEDAIWRTGRRGQEAELALKKKLKGIFWRTLRKKNLRVWHNLMKAYIISKGVGTIRGMGYDRFRLWMKETGATDGGIKEGPMKGMDYFAENYEKNMEEEE